LKVAGATYHRLLSQIFRLSFLTVRILVDLARNMNSFIDLSTSGYYTIIGLPDC